MKEEYLIRLLHTKHNFSNNIFHKRLNLRLDTDYSFTNSLLRLRVSLLLLGGSGEFPHTKASSDCSHVVSQLIGTRCAANKMTNIAK